MPAALYSTSKRDLLWSLKRPHTELKETYSSAKRDLIKETYYRVKRDLLKETHYRVKRDLIKETYYRA